MLPDNVELSLLSLQDYLTTILDNNKVNGCSIFIGGDDDLVNKQIVEKATDERVQIQLPIVILDTGTTRQEIQELGNAAGNDLVTLSIIVIAKNKVQLTSIGHLIRRTLNDLIFDIYDYTSNKRRITANRLGTAIISDVVSIDISDWESDNPAERYSYLINGTLEVSATTFVS
jgi:hypothetical protein